MNKGLIRIIIWSLFTFMFMLLGFFGLFKNIQSNSLTLDEKELFDKIIYIYNNSKYVNDLKMVNIITTSSLKRKQLNIRFSDKNVDNLYRINYDNNYFYFEFDNNDDNAKIVSKILLDAINVSNGRNEGETFYTFENIMANGFSNDEALSISIGDATTEIIFNTKRMIAIEKENTELINQTILLENIEKIKSFDYVYVSDNINLTLDKDSISNNVKIIQTIPFDKNTYSLLITIFSFLLRSDEMNTFINEYNEIKNDEKLEFDKYRIFNEEENGIHYLTVQIYNKD